MFDIVELDAATMLPSKRANGVTSAIKRLLQPHKCKRFSVALDNGKEFSRYEEIVSALKLKVYFAHTYCSWKRGLNENTNGLLRQYFPKGALFDTVTDAEMQTAVTALNHRPRKILGFKSPFEVLFGKAMHYTVSAQVVALQI